MFVFKKLSDCSEICLAALLQANFRAIRQFSEMQSYQHIEAETKWSPFSRRQFEMDFWNENAWISIKISLKFVPGGPMNTFQSLVQILVWRRPGDKPLSEPMMVSLMMHICITLLQWVNAKSHSFETLQDFQVRYLIDSWIDGLVADSIYRCHVTSIGIPIIKIRWSQMVRHGQGSTYPLVWQPGASKIISQASGLEPSFLLYSIQADCKMPNFGCQANRKLIVKMYILGCQASKENWSPGGVSKCGPVSVYGWARA